jgi:hypothetical protein
MTKLEKLYRRMNDHLKEAMAEMGVLVESEWNFIENCLVTRTVDGKDMTPAQMEYLKGYSAGYADAKSKVYET